MSIHHIVAPVTIVLSLLVVALMAACAPPVTTTPRVKVAEVEVEVTSTPQVQVVEVMATPTPLPPTPSTSRLPVISVDNADQVGLLRRFEIPDFRKVRETCGVAFSPGGKYLAAACKSDVIPLWNVESNKYSPEFVERFYHPGGRIVHAAVRQPRWRCDT